MSTEQGSEERRTKTRKGAGKHGFIIAIWNRTERGAPASQHTTLLLAQQWRRSGIRCPVDWQQILPKPKQWAAQGLGPCVTVHVCQVRLSGLLNPNGNGSNYLASKWLFRNAGNESSLWTRFLKECCFLNHCSLISFLAGWSTKRAADLSCG